MFLMLKDIPVMEIDISDGIYKVLNEKLLPYSLKGRIINNPYEDKDLFSKYEMTQMRIIDNKNRDAVISFFANRTLPLSRENAKKIYNLFMFDQIQSDENRARISLSCRIVSLQDNYWVKIEGDDTEWKDVNLFTNSLSDIVAQVSLHGTSLSLTGKVHTPEITGQGAYAKAWIRKEDGLYLLKKGAKDATEARIEVMVSKILDLCNVEHIKYEPSYTKDFDGNDIYCCSCRCMTDENLSILTGMDFVTYCNVNGLDFEKEIFRIDPDMIYKMYIVDYLISNTDRHGLNWGLFVDSDTNEILRCHPLFDHNNAFDKAAMADPTGGRYIFTGRHTMQQAARIGMMNTDFHFFREPVREDFITDRQYHSFIKRFRELSVPIKK